MPYGRKSPKRRILSSEREVCRASRIIPRWIILPEPPNPPLLAGTAALGITSEATSWPALTREAMVGDGARQAPGEPAGEVIGRGDSLLRRGRLALTTGRAGLARGARWALHDVSAAVAGKSALDSLLGARLGSADGRAGVGAVALATAARVAAGTGPARRNQATATVTCGATLDALFRARERNAGPRVACAALISTTAAPSLEAAVVCGDVGRWGTSGAIARGSGRSPVGT